VLAQIGQADAEIEQGGKFVRREQARRQADRVQRRPEFVLLVRVIGLRPGRDMPGRGTTENEIKIRTQQVRQNRRGSQAA
jgi:hypothetical protein